MKLGDLKGIKKVIKRLEKFSYSDDNPSVWRLNLVGNIVKLTYLPENKITEFDLLQLIIENNIGNIGGFNLSLVVGNGYMNYIKLRVSSYTTVASLLSGLFLDYLIKKNNGGPVCFTPRQFLLKKVPKSPFFLIAKEVEFKDWKGSAISNYDYTFVRTDLVSTVDIKIEAFTLLISFDLVGSDSLTI